MVETQALLILYNINMKKERLSIVC